MVLLEETNLSLATSSSSSSKNPSSQDKTQTLTSKMRREPSQLHLSRRLPLMEVITNRNKVPYSRNIADTIRNHPPFLYGMNLMKKLPVHTGCVNTVCWNKTGEYLLSGSDDKNLCITKPSYLFDTSKDYTIIHKVPTRHLGNIFSASFMPVSGDSLIVSCSSDGPVIVHDIFSSDESRAVLNYNCHASTIYEVVPIPDEDKVFLTCGEDSTIRLFDMRCHRSCARPDTCPHVHLVRCKDAITTLKLHPRNSNLVLAGRADGVGLLFDRRKYPDPREFSREKADEEYRANGCSSWASKQIHPMDGVLAQFSVPNMDCKNRFTSLCYNSDGSQILASYSQDYIYLFDTLSGANLSPQLIQTLPVRSLSNNDNNNNNNNNNSSESTSGSSGGNSTGQRPPRQFLNPRIRVRGDWSDTGANSVPQSTRSDNEDEGTSDITFSFSSSLFGGSRRLACRNRPNRESSPLTEEESREADEDQVEDSENEKEEEEEGGNTNDEAGSSKKCRKDSINSDSIMEEEDADEESSEVSGKSSRPKISDKTKKNFRSAFNHLKDRISRIPSFKPHVKYQGHRNSRTCIKKAIFWGDDYIMSGSDCGRIMVWEKKTAKLIMAFSADEHVVNCLAPNPHHYVLASSGIDYDIKLWSTQAVFESPLKPTESEIESIVKINELMLEEAKQTIVLPPQMFYRVLASLVTNRFS